MIMDHHHSISKQSAAARGRGLTARSGEAGPRARGWWLAGVFLLAAQAGWAQEALRNAAANSGPRLNGPRPSESLPYTYRCGDFRVLASGSLGIDWNDNISIAPGGAAQDDFILRPSVGMELSYPLTQRNLLQVHLGLGYDKYLQHDEFSYWRVASGSAVSFEMAIGDFWLDFHDRLEVSQDSARQAAVANSGMYGVIENTVGVSGFYELKDANLNLGYDHRNMLSTSEEFNQTTHAGELFTLRPGFRVHPRVNAGLEATAAMTRYEQRKLNDSQTYTVGAYADWQPSSFFRLQPRAGYSIYEFEQTSLLIPASDATGWYVDVALEHQPSEAVAYTLSVGHQLNLGIYSDTTEEWYAHLSVSWNILRNTTLRTTAGYAHGKQGSTALGNGVAEVYDQFTTGANLGYVLTKRLSVSLDYRFTSRTADVALRDYDQNVVGLLFTYTMQ